MNYSAVVLLNVFLFVGTEASLKAGHQTDIRTSNYLSFLINSETQRDTSRNHDVALIRLEEKFKSGMFEIVADRFLEKSENNAVYVHSSFDVIPRNRTLAFSFFIIFSDMTDKVSPSHMTFPHVASIAARKISHKGIELSRICLLKCSCAIPGADCIKFQTDRFSWLSLFIT